MMKVRVEDDRIYVQSDYNKAFISKAKHIQGKWNNPFWVFPAENREELKELLIDTYGEADILEEYEGQKITVDLDLDYFPNPTRGEIRLGGILVASRPHRDSPVRLAENCMLIKGGFAEYGGSRTAPEIAADKETVIRVKNIPCRIFEKIKNKSGITVVCEEGIDVKALIEERKRLFLRLKEITDLLEKHGQNE